MLRPTTPIPETTSADRRVLSTSESQQDERHHDESPSIESTDAELLMRFERHGDDTAFAELVHKHGPMVMAVCRQSLRQQQDAEDAFQAVWIVLLRRGRAIRDRSSFGGWLYRVAHRTALRAARHRRPEVAMYDEHTEQVDSLVAVGRHSLVRDLLDEIDELPERYRDPLVLVYLEGKSYAEAASELECTDAAVRGRLTRGKRLLRTRLLRQSVSLASAMAIAGVATGARVAQAEMARFVELASAAASATVGTAATGLTSSSTATSTSAGSATQVTLAETTISLAEEGMRAMLFTSLTTKIAATVVVLCATFGVWSLQTDSIARADSGSGEGTPTLLALADTGGGDEAVDDFDVAEADETTDATEQFVVSNDATDTSSKADGFAVASADDATVPAAEDRGSGRTSQAGARRGRRGDDGSSGGGGFGDGGSGGSGFGDGGSGGGGSGGGGSAGGGSAGVGRAGGGHGGAGGYGQPGSYRDVYGAGRAGAFPAGRLGGAFSEPGELSQPAVDVIVQTPGLAAEEYRSQGEYYEQRAKAMEMLAAAHRDAEKAHGLSDEDKDQRETLLRSSRAQEATSKRLDAEAEAKWLAARANLAVRKAQILEGYARTEKDGSSTDATSMSGGFGGGGYRGRIGGYGGAGGGYGDGGEPSRRQPPESRSLATPADDTPESDSQADRIEKLEAQVENLTKMLEGKKADPGFNNDPRR